MMISYADFYIINQDPTDEEVLAERRSQQLRQNKRPHRYDECTLENWLESQRLLTLYDECTLENLLEAQKFLTL